MGSRASFGALLGLLPALACCSRSAEIADDFDAGVNLGGAPVDDAELIFVDAGFEESASLPCAQREDGSECRGSNDFPCNFRPWVTRVVDECQTATGCVSSGRVVVQMGDQGCVVGLQMSQPNARFAECTARRFGQVRCSCTSEKAEETLGYFNDGCPESGPLACRSGEFPCPVGFRCVAGFCRSEPGTGGGGG